jgi:hydrocephalus-inducing protein
VDFSSKGSKVAPGMEITFIIRFSPEAKIDYSYDLVVVTEREKFVVPIVAIGKRSMMYLLYVATSPTCWTSRTVL